MRVAVVACGAIALHVGEIAERRGWQVDVHPLPPELHNRPERIAPRVAELLDRLEAGYDRVVVGYADCGTFGALDAELRRADIPRLAGMHCYDVFGRDEVREAMAEQPGTYFLTDFLARSFDRTVWRSLGLDRHPDLRDAYFGNYTRVVWLAQRPTPELRGRRPSARLRCWGCRWRSPRSATPGWSASWSRWSWSRRMTRAALLPAAGTPLRVVDLDLAPPGPDEVQVRLHASGVCSDDLNVLDGTVDVPSPLVPGHEGAGVVEALGEGVRDLAVGDHVALSWAPYCGHCDECLRDLPHLCSTAWPMMLQGGLLDGTTRLSFGGAVVHHYCFLSSFSERAVVPARSCVRIPDDVPFEVAALLGCAVTSGVCAVWRTAQVRPGDRVAVFGLGGTGLSAVLGAVAAGASQIVAVDARQSRLERALALGASAAVHWEGEPEDVAISVTEASGGGVDFAFETAGRPANMRAAFLSTRARGAAVLAGIPRADAELRLPALSIPRMERRVLGSIYGSARPDHDFPLILDLYQRGPAAARPADLPPAAARRGRGCGATPCAPARRRAQCSSSPESAW